MCQSPRKGKKGQFIANTAQKGGAISCGNPEEKTLTFKTGERGYIAEKIGNREKTRSTNIVKNEGGKKKERGGGQIVFREKKTPTGQQSLEKGGEEKSKPASYLLRGRKKVAQEALGQREWKD